MLERVLSTVISELVLDSVGEVPMLSAPLLGIGAITSVVEPAGWPSLFGSPVPSEWRWESATVVVDDVVVDDVVVDDVVVDDGVLDVESSAASSLLSAWARS